VPTAPTAAANTDTPQIATTAFAKAEADAAQAAAEATAAADATTKANAAQSAATTAAATDATTKANAAQSAATTAAATDATTKANAAQAAAEATAASALTAVKNGTTKFTAVNVNDLVSQRAAQAVLASIATGSSVMSWAKSDYPTAKLWVKFATATHSQISEILLTTDSSNNIAITDFAETGTNGSLGTITASYVAGNIGIEVNTVYANTTVTVVATLIK
jgi:multidrug efflux pump subunit AcrA (membrane-fusion protein)